MSDTTIVLITLVIYKVILLLIGFWASKRSQSTTDYFLAGRQLGPWVAAISASASSSSAWTLLGVSGAAYLWGFSAIWLLPSVLLGFCFNWFWLAPRIQKLSQAEKAVTLTDLLVPQPHQTMAITIRRAATMIIVFSFTFYIASQFKAAGTSFNSVFDLSFNHAIILGALIIMIYTLLGGFWAVSVTDTLQGLLMAGTALVLPIAALIHLGGLGEMVTKIDHLQLIGFTSWSGEHSGIAAIGFIIGLLGIGNGYPGQPHVVNRFMALKDKRSLKQGRVIALTWAMFVYVGMLILGWSGRVIVPFLSDGESVFFAVTQSLFSPMVAGIMIAAVLSAVMSTADSQILVVSSSVAYDLKPGQRTHSVLGARLAVLGVCLFATLLALYMDDAIFSRVLFAWHAIGSAFGPILIVRLMHRQMNNGIALWSMMVGFGLTVFINHYPNWPGDFAERWIPFTLAFAIALLGSKKPS